MSNQIILAWKVNVAGTSIGPAEANTKLAAVPLYADPTTDPFLGQALGLTVANDATTNDATSATRTLTLNMTAAVGTPHAPPPFPCHPDTSTPPTLPYVLRKTVTLAGSFLVVNGSMTVDTSANQVPALVHLDVVEFAAQQGVFYTVNTIGPTAIVLTAPYTGNNDDAPAVKIKAAPATLPAIYSTSPLDTAGVATVPAVPAGPGARTVNIEYLDSTGAGPFLVTVSLTGRRPAAVALHAGSVDIASIEDIWVVTSGGFGNSVGQVTLCDLSSALPAIPPDATPDDFNNKLTDVAQLLVDRGLAYLPPSYFALSAQGAATPALAGDFMVRTGSPNVPTTEDQTGALSAGNAIRFASQPSNDTPFGREDVTYVVADVTPKLVILTEPYAGLDRTNKYDSDNVPRPSNVTAKAQNQPTGAVLVTPSPAAPPTNAQLGSLMAQFVNPGNAVPPPNRPLAPQAMSPVPTLLSGMFTQTLSLALAVPVIPQPIAFA